MKHSHGDSAIYTCDFCGMSSRGDASMFLSRIDKATAICKPCVDGLPLVYGKVIEFSAPDRVMVANQLADATAQQLAAARRNA